MSSIASKHREYLIGISQVDSERHGLAYWVSRAHEDFSPIVQWYLDVQRETSLTAILVAGADATVAQRAVRHVSLDAN